MAHCAEYPDEVFEEAINKSVLTSLTLLPDGFCKVMATAYHLT